MASRMTAAAAIRTIDNSKSNQVGPDFQNSGANERGGSAVAGVGFEEEAGCGGVEWTAGVGFGCEAGFGGGLYAWSAEPMASAAWSNA